VAAATPYHTRFVPTADYGTAPPLDRRSCPVWKTTFRPVAEIERMLGAAAGTDGLHDALDMPVAVASFDVDPANGVVRGEQHRRLPAATLPAEQEALGRIHAA